MWYTYDVTHAVSLFITQDSCDDVTSGMLRNGPPPLSDYVVINNYRYYCYCCSRAYMICIQCRVATGCGNIAVSIATLHTR